MAGFNPGADMMWHYEVGKSGRTRYAGARADMRDFRVVRRTSSVVFCQRRAPEVEDEKQ